MSISEGGGGKEPGHVIHREDGRPVGTRSGVFVRTFGLAGSLALLLIIAGYLAFWEGDVFKRGDQSKMMAPSGLVFVLGGAERGRGPDLGKEVPPADLAPWDISIPPGGEGLPPGKGVPEEGFHLYQEKCVACHGKKGRGLSAEELAGEIGSLAQEWPEQTVGSYWPYATTLFDYIRRAMPPGAPLSLSDDEVYALCAYLLYLNGIIDSEAEMNERTLAGVVMPNRDGFEQIYQSPLR